MRDGQPKAILRRDYQPPPFLVDDVHLDFFLDEHATRVRSRLTLRRNPDADRQADLVLDGQDLKLERVVLDGEERALGDVRIADESRTLPGVPDAFVLELETVCDPAANKSLEGLYVSSGNFCTQCEAEGFRKITYYLDRPDVMAPFTVRVEGDKQRHPVLLSNGNPIARGDVGADRHFVVWQDPFKKPCYLFALVAGTLVRREDRFTTVSGREVDLHVYVEDGNLEKTAWCMESLKQSMAWDEKRLVSALAQGGLHGLPRSGVLGGHGLARGQAHRGCSAAPGGPVPRGRRPHRAPRAPRQLRRDQQLLHAHRLRKGR
jgi:aminopeptidase N